eukprot:1934742-Amphidinium_carterae.2
MMDLQSRGRGFWAIKANLATDNSDGQASWYEAACTRWRMNTETKSRRFMYRSELGFESLAEICEDICYNAQMLVWSVQHKIESKERCRARTMRTHPLPNTVPNCEMSIINSSFSQTSSQAQNNT